MTLQFTIPLPPKELSPNARPHHMAKARVKREYRTDCGLAIRAAMDSEGWPVTEATVQATFYFSQNRKRDKDNLLASLKQVWDALADAGAIVDDCGLTHLPVKVERTSTQPRVEVTLETLE